MTEDSSSEEQDAGLDSLWSLQYMTGPGILCAFAGQLHPFGTPNIREGLAGHAAHFRFTDPQVAPLSMNQAATGLTQICCYCNMK